MKIGIDLEDVLFDLTTGLMKAYTKETGKTVKYEDLDNYYWFDEDLIERFNESHIIEEINPLKGAPEAIQALLKKQDELYIITAKKRIFSAKVDAWIQHHLKTNKLIVTYTEGVKKSIICKALGISLLIDDAGHNALECAQEGITVILFNKPWNQGVFHHNIIQVHSWTEAIEEINKLRKK